MFEVQKPTDDRPLWAQIALWGIQSRTVAWICCGLSALLALIGYFGLRDGRVFALGLAVALWYYLSIRWVDRHGRWQPDRG